MKNITLSADEELLKAGRDYARAHNTSLNDLIRKLLAQAVSREQSRWLDDVFELMD